LESQPQNDNDSDAGLDLDPQDTNNSAKEVDITSESIPEQIQQEAIKLEDSDSESAQGEKQLGRGFRKSKSVNRNFPSFRPGPDGDREYRQCLRKRSVPKRMINEDDALFNDYLESENLKYKKSKKKKYPTRGRGKTVMNTPMSTPFKFNSQPANANGENPQTSNNYINSIHFFSKRREKDRPSISNKIKVDDTLSENIFERLLQREIMKYTEDDQKFVEPSHEIVNSFYKFYDVFRQSLLNVQGHNTNVKDYNENIVTPFYETLEFKKKMLDHTQNFTQDPTPDENGRNPKDITGKPFEFDADDSESVTKKDDVIFVFFKPKH
jgi:hypothetical protein